MKNIVLILSVSILTAACSGGGKKVLVISSGNIEIGENSVTQGSGSSHNEKAISVNGNSLKVVTASGEEAMNIPEEGFYILNLKKDTLVGSYQRTGTDYTPERITQENLQQRLDSLNQLMRGSNVNAENRNYNLAPGTLTKITGNVQATIIGPFKTVPGSFEAGKEYEIYKFYTSKEMQEIITKLQGMVSDPEAEE